MAIFHQLETIIKRGTHTCTMATAAYRGGSKLKLETYLENGVVKSYDFDFSTKKGILYSVVATPASLEKFKIDQQMLWQMVEDSTKEYDAVLAKEFTIALPEELTVEENISLINDYINTSILPRGLTADINFHREHANNPHFHVIFPINILDINDAGDLYVGSVNEKWTDENYLECFRVEIAQIINTHLEKSGFSTRISHISEHSPKYDSFRPWL